MPAALRSTERDRDGRGGRRERGPRRRRHRRLQELQVRAGARLTPLEGRPQGSEGNLDIVREGASVSDVHARRLATNLLTTKYSYGLKGGPQVL